MPAPAELEAIARGAAAPPLDADDRERIAAGRAVVEQALAEGRVVYGVSTGFGQLSSVRIDAADAARLQVNLLRSHAVGSGEPLPREVVRAMLALLAASLRRGHSGVRAEVVELLLAMLAHDVVPRIPSQRLGRLLGRPRAARPPGARADRRGRGARRRRPGGEALAAAGLEPVTLAAKEGLALINGTHLMAAAGALAVLAARRVLDAAIVAVALSLEAFKGSTVPFDARLHAVRGPARARRGSRRGCASCSRARPWSPRTPTAAGCRTPTRCAARRRCSAPSHDALGYVEAALERELHAVTDNPLVFAADDAILSGGNFHGQPLSLPLDHLALAMTELASFSERRTYALLTPGYAGLPAFLTPQPGLSSGLMIAQYTAAALVNECQVLAHPAGAGSIPTSAGMEDFNSMGAWAALKARTVVGLAAHVVATELVCACQGLEFHRPLRTTERLEGYLATVRSVVPRVEEDRSLAAELAALAERVQDQIL